MKKTISPGNLFGEIDVPMATKERRTVTAISPI